MPEESQPLTQSGTAAYYSKEQPNIPLIINSEEGGYEQNPPVDTYVNEKDDKRARWMFILGFLVPVLPCWILACLLYARSKSVKAKKFGVWSGYLMVFNFTFWVLLVQWVIIPLVAMSKKQH